MTLCKLKLKKAEVHIPLNDVRINSPSMAAGVVCRCFFLTGLIWARTVFCIDMGNIVYRNMVKIHLPHMYMIFVECYRKQILCSTDLQYCTKLFNTFRIRSALSSLSLQTLWVRCNFFRNTFFFFWLWSRSISSLSLPYSNLGCNFLIFLPRPVMVVKLDQKYLEP